MIIGGLFLWRNLHPEAPVFDLLAQYWPFLLIGWGLLRLVEGLIWHREGVRGSFTGGEVVLVILICIAGSGIWAGARARRAIHARRPGFLGPAVRLPGVGDAPARPGMKRIVFENPRGNIKVTGGDTTDVTVTGHKVDPRVPARTPTAPTAEHPGGDRARKATACWSAPTRTTRPTTSGSPTTWK